LAAGKATWNIWCNSLSPAGIIPVAGFDLRPSKEPPHIATGDLGRYFIAGEWAMRFRHFCRRRPKSNGSK